MKWLLPQWVGRKPIKHLFAHCSSGTFDSNSILLFGGSDGRQSVNEFSVLNFDFPSLEEEYEQDEGEYDDFAEGGEYMENQDGEQENQGQLGQGDQGEFQGQGQENY